VGTSNSLRPISLKGNSVICWCVILSSGLNIRVKLVSGDCAAVAVSDSVRSGVGMVGGKVMIGVTRLKNDLRCIRGPQSGWRAIVTVCS